VIAVPPLIWGVKLDIQTGAEVDAESAENRLSGFFFFLMRTPGLAIWLGARSGMRAIQSFGMILVVTRMQGRPQAVFEQGPKRNAVGPCTATMSVGGRTLSA